MQKKNIQNRIKSLEKEYEKLKRNFVVISQKDDDNDFVEQKRIDIILDLLNNFKDEIQNLKLELQLQPQF